MTLNLTLILIVLPMCYADSTAEHNHLWIPHVNPNRADTTFNTPYTEKHKKRKESVPSSEKKKKKRKSVGSKKELQAAIDENCNFDEG